ncbi:MAG TPA: ubiquitin-like domain-containing protein [Kineosporiaceae bacterium]|nr:ubiquitin-like domain-containing protein [Kineosporiaceae bacterium]
MCDVWSAVLGFLTGRVGRVAAQSAVLTAVIGGTIAYSHVGKKVYLSVDGQSREVNVEAGTVRALLAAENLDVSDRDLVAPAPSTPLSSGDHVVVRFARQLVLTLDGRTQTYWTTELTVDQALTALGVHADGAELSSSRSQPIGRKGFNLTISTRKSVTIAADGVTRTVVTSAPTVGELLKEQGIALGAADRLSAVPATPVTEGMVLALTRITQTTVTVTEKVPYGSNKKKSATLDAGQTQVLTPGRNGSRTAVYAVLLANGQEVSRTLQSATVLTQPVDEVVAVGTKPVPAPSGGSSNVGGSVDSLNWAALAKCESGGNPRAVNPAGYYGLYQFSVSTWRSVGGSGNPIDAAPAEQTLRAKMLYQRGGARQWGCGQKLFS